MKPFQSSFRSEESKFKVHGTVAWLPPSGRKHKLSPAAGRTLIRMDKSQPKTNEKQVGDELEAAGRLVTVSTVPESSMEVCCLSPKHTC